MANLTTRDTLKRILGYIPLTAEMYYMLREQNNKPLVSHFTLTQLQRSLPKMVEDVVQLNGKMSTAEPKKILLFASLHWWIQHAATMGMVLAAQGHDVTIGYLPYADWQTDVNAFDLRQQNAYAKQVLSLGEPYIKNVSFLKIQAQYRALSPELQKIVKEVSEYDCMYTLRNEEVDEDSELYKFRLDRNGRVGRVVMSYFEEDKPDLVIVPNGSIQEMGVVYRYANYLGIKTVTYEFSDKRDHIWLAQDEEVMRQNTKNLWEARKPKPLSEDEWNQVKSLFSARQNGNLWENFSRLWQGQATEGGEAIREKLGLDERPIVLLPTNVLGDSLTLGRNKFTKSMEDWIIRTLQYFLGRPDVQLVIRVHPGELVTEGQSILSVVNTVTPVLPEHIHIIAPDEKVNTYDLMEISTLGMVFTTTVGMEMAMRGKPVIVIGDTHYRERGFTLDPESWVDYYKTIGKVLQNPKAYQLTEEQVNSAWKYAYTFFFEYPLPYPWHVVNFWSDYKEKSIKEITSAKNWKRYSETFSYISGETLDWFNILG